MLKVKTPKYLPFDEAALFRRCVEDLERLGVEAAVGVWQKSFFTNENFDVAAMAVISRKINTLSELQALCKLSSRPADPTKILMVAIQLATTGQPHTLEWVKGLVQVAPWNVEKLAKNFFWVRRLHRFLDTTPRLKSRRWAFLWKEMAKRWVNEDKVLHNGGQLLGSTNDVVAFAIIAELAGPYLKLSPAAMKEIHRRLEEDDWREDFHANVVERLHVRSRHVLLQVAASKAGTSFASGVKQAPRM